MDVNEVMIANETNDIISNNKSNVEKDEGVSSNTEIISLTNDKDTPVESLKHHDNDICIVHENITILPAKTNEKISSLSTIAAEYGNSDSEIEDNSDLNKQENDNTACTKEVQIQSYRLNKETSSSEESDSEDDSTSSSDSSVIVESVESDSDDSTNKKNKENNTKGRKGNELKSELDDLPPIEDLKISVPEVLCDPLGEVAWMVEQLVVVRPKPGKPTLNLDTVLFVDKGQRALGKVFDVFGQVNEPHYCVRFNSSEHIQECDIKVGMTVYYCPNTEYTSLVFLHELMKIKGIDVTADEPPEFSDDEEERVYYEKLKAKQKNNANETDIPFKRKRATSPTSGWQSNHPWNRNTQRNRRGHYPRGGHRQFPPMQATNQLHGLWHSPQNNWPPIPRHLYPENGEQCGYGAYSTTLRSVQYVNPNVNSSYQDFHASHNYYCEDGSQATLHPRIPFNAYPRFPLQHFPFQNRSNSSPNLRFRNPDMYWQSQMPQIPATSNIPDVSLPPPPPPPPSSSSSGTS